MAQDQAYPTIWEIPDDLWEAVKILLQEYDPPAVTGRPRDDWRPILNAIIHRFRTGCQWKRLPKEFGDDSKIHRVFQHWVKLEVFEKIWGFLLAECDELEQVQWNWQAADGWLGKSRMGGDLIGPNPTDRGKNGTKKSLLTDGEGGPLSIVIAPANVNDHKLLERTLDSIVIERPEPSTANPQHLCLDKAYDNRQSREIVKKHRYKDHRGLLGFPRFFRHLTRRDNAPGGGPDEEKETAAHAGVQKLMRSSWFGQAAGLSHTWRGTLI
jgi:putative transposase